MAATHSAIETNEPSGPRAPSRERMRPATTSTPTPIRSATPASGERRRIGFGRALGVGLGASILAVFAATTVILGLYLDDFLAAAGVALYLAFWLGLGLGFMAGAIRWAVDQEDH